MNDIKKKIGSRLKEIREQMKYTQEEIAAMMDITAKHYGEVERGNQSFSLENWVRLASILPIDFNYLFLGQTGSSIQEEIACYSTIDPELTKIILSIKQYAANQKSSTQD